MARTKRIKETAAGAAFYHVISRTNNKVSLFDSPKTKDALVDALVRSAAFSGVDIEAYAIMSNHVHAVVKVTRPVGSVPNASCGCRLGKVGENIASGRETADFSVPLMGSVPSLAEAIPEAELLRRVGILKGEKAREELAMEWRELRKAGLIERL